MSFDQRDIRVGMDVYTSDHAYLGSVRKIIAGPAAPRRDLVSPGARQSSAVSGELGGPVPTLPLGNSGPASQSAAADYATAPDTAALIGPGWIVVSRWWGLFRRRLPAHLVQTVSLEQVVLTVRREEL